MPLQAVTRAGWERVSAGSSRAMRAAALGSPQAIFWWVCSSVIRAKDWHSLPVPPVVGMAMQGQHGARGLADAPVILHLAAVGENEIAALGGVHAAAAAQADDRVDAGAAGDLDASLHAPGRGVLLDLVEARHLHARGFQQARCTRPAWPAATIPRSVTSSTFRAARLFASSPTRSTLLTPKTIRVRGW